MINMKFYGIMYGDGDGYGVMLDKFFKTPEAAIKYAKETCGWEPTVGNPANCCDVAYVGYTDKCYVVECHLED